MYDEGFIGDPDLFFYDSEETTGHFPNAPSSEFEGLHEVNAAALLDQSNHTSVLDLSLEPQEPTAILQKFRKQHKPPKKEYVRCTMIRGHKRCLRQIESQKQSKSRLNRQTPATPLSITLWEGLTNEYYRCREFLEPVSRTEAGPATDGQSRRRVVDRTIPRSFNNTFCRDYFGHPAVSQHYCLYVDYVFADHPSEVLCHKFDMNCCESALHGPHCEDKWEELKCYLKFTILEEIGCLVHQREEDHSLLWNLDSSILDLNSLE